MPVNGWNFGVVDEHNTRLRGESPVASPLKVEFQFDFGSPNAIWRN
jgi:hypothetical protein